ncbi:MAG: hypothetical protein WCL10_09585 [Novosphingobium sp.]
MTAPTTHADIMRPEDMQERLVAMDEGLGSDHAMTVATKPGLEAAK